jgi:SAM-dependent methyltransferase
MDEAQKRFTRGRGVFEPLLARLRARRANQLILPALREGRILDIGCGSYPYFLSHTSFKEKFAIDQQPPATTRNDIHWHTLDLNSEPKLPFEDGYFNVITMLAVVEHLDPNSLVILFQEAYRTLKPGGMVVVTTPAAWSDPLLKWMARFYLVSPEEIHEHVYAYTLPLLGWYFGKGGFSMDNVQFGYFEFMLNMWATATR